jgi:hypothetical protein
VADAYWEYRLKPWDMAAGVLIAEEAGGSVTTMDGRAFSVFDRSVLVTNGFLHDKMLARTEPKTAALLAGGTDLSAWAGGVWAGGGAWAGLGAARQVACCSSRVAGAGWGMRR